MSKKIFAAGVALLLVSGGALAASDVGGLTTASVATATGVKALFVAWMPYIAYFLLFIAICMVASRKVAWGWPVTIVAVAWCLGNIDLILSVGGIPSV